MNSICRGELNMKKFTNVFLVFSLLFPLISRAEDHWIRKNAIPNGRSGHALAYDASLKHVVLFGGFARSPRFGDTWSLTAAGWHFITERGPSIRNGAAMEFFPSLNVIVLFGGMDGERKVHGDTWLLQKDHWKELILSEPSPSPRFFHASAYDPLRQRLVLFGGKDADGNMLDDMWEFDGQTWNPIDVIGPSARYGARMVYDVANKCIVLFGGAVSETDPCGDTWVYKDSKWQELPGPGPSARYVHAMTYDEHQSRIVLFGGTPNNWDTFGDTWALKDGSWQKIKGEGPSPRSYVSMTYDPSRKCAILFGGYTLGYGADTWQLTDKGWQQLDFALPHPREACAMTFDAQNRQVVVFGGHPDGTSTWLHDNNGWEKTSAIGPKERDYAAMAYDAERRMTLLFGGEVSGEEGLFLGDTWLWDGSQWSLAGDSNGQQESHSQPQARTQHGLIFDASKKKVVLFGGYSKSGCLNDTWLWDGAQWTQTAQDAANVPTPRMGHRLVYDFKRNYVFLFGGRSEDSLLNDVWILTSKGWQELQIANSPSPRWDYAICYDAQKDRILLWGGYGDQSGRQRLSDLWEFKGDTWSEIKISGSAPQTSVTMTYDPVRNVALLFDVYGLWELGSH